MKSFKYEVKSLLRERIKEKKINLTKFQTRGRVTSFKVVDGKLRYNIAANVLKELTPEIIKEIEELWAKETNPDS